MFVRPSSSPFIGVTIVPRLVTRPSPGESNACSAKCGFENSKGDYLCKGKLPQYGKAT